MDALRCDEQPAVPDPRHQAHQAVATLRGEAAHFFCAELPDAPPVQSAWVTQCSSSCLVQHLEEKLAAIVSTGGEALCEWVFVRGDRPRQG